MDIGYVQYTAVPTNDEETKNIWEQVAVINRFLVLNVGMPYTSISVLPEDGYVQYTAVSTNDEETKNI